jgi:hypothetical protein
MSSVRVWRETLSKLARSGRCAAMCTAVITAQQMKLREHRAAPGRWDPWQPPERNRGTPPSRAAV